MSSCMFNAQPSTWPTVVLEVSVTVSTLSTVTQRVPWELRRSPAPLVSRDQTL